MRYDGGVNLKQWAERQGVSYVTARRLARVTAWATGRGITVGRVVTETGSAPLNLAEYGEHQLAGSGPDSDGRGAGRKTTPGSRVAVKRQPGTAHAGQTGTVPRQCGTAI